MMDFVQLETIIIWFYFIEKLRKNNLLHCKEFLMIIDRELGSELTNKLAAFDEMPRCQAMDSNYMTGVHKLSFFSIRDPEKLRNIFEEYAEGKERVAEWLRSIGRGWNPEALDS